MLTKKSLIVSRKREEKAEERTSKAEKRIRDLEFEVSKLQHEQKKTEEKNIQLEVFLKHFVKKMKIKTKNKKK